MILLMEQLWLKSSKSSTFNSICWILLPARSSMNSQIDNFWAAKTSSIQGKMFISTPKKNEKCALSELLTKVGRFGGLLFKTVLPHKYRESGRNRQSLSIYGCCILISMSRFFTQCGSSKPVLVVQSSYNPHQNFGVTTQKMTNW